MKKQITLSLLLGLFTFAIIQAQVSQECSTPAPFEGKPYTIETTTCHLYSPVIDDLPADKNLIWYDSENSTLALSPKTIVVDKATYYVSQIIDGCESKQRTAVNVMIGVMVWDIFPMPFCSIENKRLVDIMENVAWFKTPSTEFPLPKSTPLVEGETYYIGEGKCFYPYEIKIDAPIKPQVTVDCASGKAKITVANPVEGYTYSLNGGAFQTSLEFTSVTNGSHVITAKSNNDCKAQSDKITIFCDPIEPVVNIPDPEFKRSLVENKSINTNSDNEIQVSEAENYTGILTISSLYNIPITDVTGIEAFVNITELESSTALNSIDLSKNIKLTRLDLNNFQKASSLDLSNNKLLNYLWLSNGIELRSLDFSNNPEIRILIIVETNITQLNITKNYKLEQLHINGSLLKELDISNNTELKIFNSTLWWPLEKLDLSNNIKLEHFSIVTSPFIEEVDLSKNINLISVSIDDTQNLRKLNLKNGNNENMSFTLRSQWNAPLDLLNCVMVDDPEYSKLNWAIPEGSKIEFTTDCATLSVSENELNTLNTTFSPNPTQGKITFTEKVDEVKVFDLSGRLVKSITVNTSEVDLSDLQNGVYMMQVNQGQRTFTTKVIKE